MAKWTLWKVKIYYPIFLCCPGYQAGLFPAALLELLPAAARARVVAADLMAVITLCLLVDQVDRIAPARFLVQLVDGAAEI